MVDQVWSSALGLSRHSQRCRIVRGCGYNPSHSWSASHSLSSVWPTAGCRTTARVTSEKSPFHQQLQTELASS